MSEARLVTDGRLLTDGQRRAELAMRLVRLVPATPVGTTVLVPVTAPADVAVARAWCEGTGNTVLAVHPDAVEVYRGRLSDPASRVPADRMPGHRLWLYTNFHCNLACDYCCVASSPTADRRLLDAATVRRLVTEAAAAGTQEILLTGGEPFLHPEIAEVVAACTAVAPTRLLTNGMLLRGRRLRALEQMDRDRLLLQVSVDSPTPGPHDAHRGAGSWQRAVDGIGTARRLGFRVRLAATLAADTPVEEDALRELAGRLGLDHDDLLVRRVAKQGVATDGIVVSRETVVPEVCVTAEGVWWHPVAATDPAMLVRRELFPFGEAVAAVREEYLGYRRRGELLAATFPCA